jgi:hypothetical protein
VEGVAHGPFVDDAEGCPALVGLMPSALTAVADSSARRS